MHCPHSPDVTSSSVETTGPGRFTNVLCELPRVWNPPWRTPDDLQDRWDAMVHVVSVGDAFPPGISLECPWMRSAYHIPDEVPSRISNSCHFGRLGLGLFALVLGVDAVRVVERFLLGCVPFTAASILGSVRGVWPPRGIRPQLVREPRVLVQPLFGCVLHLVCAA